MNAVFIARNNEQQGPYSIEQLSTLLRQGKLSMRDFVWYQGCADWTPIHDLPDLVASVLPAIPNRIEGVVPPSLPSECSSAPPVVASVQSNPDDVGSGKAAHWWDRELWPHPTVAQLEGRVKLRNKALLISVISALVLLGIGWLFEGKEEEFPGLAKQQNYKRYGWVLNLAPDGPFGFCGAIAALIAIAISSSSAGLDRQLEKAHENESTTGQK